jgi:AcrR family transcriptional regulator
MKPIKRRQILEITEKLFNRFGIRRTGVDEIARMADVAKGTIYNYFGNKDGLFKALATEKLAVFEEMLEKSLDNIKDPIEKLRITALGHLRVSIDNPFLSDKLLYGNYDEKIRVYLAELEKKTQTVIARILDGIDSKKMAAGEKKALINTLIFTLKGMTESVRERMEPVSIRKFEKEIDFLVRALLPAKPLQQNGG